MLSFAIIISDENLATEFPEEVESKTTYGSRMLNFVGNFELNFPIQV